MLAKRAIFGKRKAEDGNSLPVRGYGLRVKNYLPSYPDGGDISTMDAHRERTMTSITSQVQRETNEN